MTKAAFDYGCSTYLPSILWVGNDRASSGQLRAHLEARGCQVHQANLSPAGLAAAHKTFFELIILHLESLDKDGTEACQRLETAARPANVPIVILTPCDPARAPTRQFETKYPIYCLSTQDAFAEVRLWQIIEQIHYLTYRYMGL